MVSLAPYLLDDEPSRYGARACVRVDRELERALERRRAENRDLRGLAGGSGLSGCGPDCPCGPCQEGLGYLGLPIAPLMAAAGPMSKLLKPRRRRPAPPRGPSTATLALGGALALALGALAGAVGGSR